MELGITTEALLLHATFFVVGLVVVVVLGLVRRLPRGAFAALAAVATFGAGIAGGYRYEVLARSPVDASLAERMAALLRYLAYSTRIWIAGAFVAAGMLSGLAIVIGRAASRTTDATDATEKRPRSLLIAVAAMLVAIGVVVTAHQAPVVLAALPCAAGLLGTFLAGAGADASARAERGTLLLSAAFGVAIVAAATAMYGPYPRVVEVLPDLEDTSRWIEASADKALPAATWPLAFVVPLAIAAVAARPRIRPGTALALPALACFFVVGTSARMVRYARDIARWPQTFARAELPIGTADACRELHPLRLLRVDSSRKVVTATGQEAAFDGDDCEGAVATIDAVAVDDAIWLTIDPQTPFGAVACLFEKLGDLRGARVAARPPGIESCKIHLVGMRGGNPSCREVFLPDARCQPSPPEKLLELALGARELRWTQGGMVILSKNYEPDDLVTTIREQWRENGSHREVTDSHRDALLVRADPTATFASALAVASASDRVVRPFRNDDRVSDRPAFDLMFASSSYRPWNKVQDAVPFDECRFGCAGDSEFGGYGIIPPEDPGASRVAVTISEPTVTGAGRLAPAAVKRALTGIVPSFRQCRAFGGSGFSEPAVVEVRFEIGTNGRVSTNARDGGHSQVPRAWIAACVRRQMNELEYPKPTGGNVEAFVRISFAPPS